MEALRTSEAVQQSFPITHSTDISLARREALQLAGRLGFNETTAGKLAIVVTEAATNILKHATTGKILITPLKRPETAGIEILALDNGPGISNLSQSFRDGISTTGTAGNGLGAMRRLSDEFDVYSPTAKGSAFYMCLWADPEKAPSGPVQFGSVCLPKIGEEVCGDAWAVRINDDSAMFMVADGLGHGPEAAQASLAAVKIMTNRPALHPERLMEAMHLGLRPTRGAAIATAEYTFATNEINFVGVGNISAGLFDGTSRRQFMSHNGIVGQNVRKFQEIKIPWINDALFVWYSDGLATQWDFGAYPGIQLCHPSLIAGILYRDFARGRDDVTVLVAKRRRTS